MNLLGRKVTRAVQRQQVGSVIVDVIFQNLAALHLTPNVAEHRPKVLGIHPIQNGAHLRVTGNLADLKNSVQVGIAAPLFKCQQGRIFEGKQREG